MEPGSSGLAASAPNHGTISLGQQTYLLVRKTKITFNMSITASEGKKGIGDRIGWNEHLKTD